MHPKLTKLIPQISKDHAAILVAVCVIVGSVTVMSHATLTDPLPAGTWALVDGGDPPEGPGNWVPYTINDGTPLYDSEGGKQDDTSNGGTSFSADSDISSGWPDLPVQTCTQTGDTQCGNGPSAFVFYFTNDTPSDLTDDYFFARMRINDDPRGPSDRGFNQSHWNFLLDIELQSPPFPTAESPPDDVKELWIDVHGGFSGGNDADVVRIIFENGPDNDISNDDGAGTDNGDGTCSPSDPPVGTWINSFVACNAPGLGGECTDGTNDLSHTRVVPTNDGTGEYFVDVVVPATAIDDNSGCYTPPSSFGDTEAWQEGIQAVNDPSDFAMLFSTSDSATDPMQKDWVAEVFGDVLTTPVTLSSFESRADGGSVLFEWTTSTETSNVGFDIYEFDGRRWKRLNDRLIPSNTVDSTSPQHYFFEADGSTGSVFKIVDISTDIKSRNHGPFELGRLYGRPARAEPIDWPAIRREHATKVRVRHGKAMAVAKNSIATGAPELRRRRGGPGVGGRSLVCDLEVGETGLYRVTGAELAAAGCDLDGVRPGNIALTNRGESVPIRVVSSGRRFGADDFVEFYGQAEDSFYTRTNVYQLLVTRRLGERVKVNHRNPSDQHEAPAAYSETLHVDHNLAYSFASPTGDPWYDTRLLAFADAPLEFDFPLQVDNLKEGPATLHVGLWGVTNWPESPDHHVKVQLNGVELADEHFDGLVIVPLALEVPDGLLREGENTLTLLSPGDTGVMFDMVHLDTYGVEYPRAFVARDGGLAFDADAKVLEVDGLPSDDLVVYRMGESKRDDEIWFVDRTEVTSSGNGYSVRFAGTNGEEKFLVATVESLLTPAIVPLRDRAGIVLGSAEYLVISHPDFLSDLAPLVEAREAQGWQVRVVDVDDVFARFSFGIFDPMAIRDYIAHAVENMGTRAVLLVGGDTFDYLDYLGVGSISFIPTVYTNTGYGAMFTPTDALLADGDGDLLPDVAIGRLPVRTSEELAAIVAKILAFEAGGHHYTAVYAADGDEPGAPFTETSVGLVNELSGSWHVTRAHIDETGKAGARAALLAALDQGVALASFIGHSSPNQWTFDGLYGTEDVSLLANVDSPTVVSQWGCWNTYFVDPEVETMAHAFMLREGGGAAAVLGAATITTFREDDAFAPLLQRHLTTPGKPIGQAVLDAKRELAETYPGMLEVILGVNLLGDPVMAVAP